MVMICYDVNEAQQNQTHCHANDLTHLRSIRTKAQDDGHSEGNQPEGQDR